MNTTATHIARVARMTDNGVEVVAVEVTRVGSLRAGTTRVRFPDGSLHDVVNDALAEVSPNAPAEILAWFRAMPPIRRAMILGYVLDTMNASELVAERCAAVFEATRSSSYRQVAEALGVSESAVNKAITQHNRNLRRN